MKQLLILFLLIGLCACKKEEKRLSVHDNSDYPAFCSKAARDEEIFAHFRKSSLITMFADQTTQEEGARYLTLLEQESPELLAYLSKYDDCGAPLLYDYGKYGFLSPSTIRQLYLAGQLKKIHGSLDGFKVVEIGGGYGQLCRILSDLFSLESYTMIDLPQCLELSKKYLKQSPHVRFVPLGQQEESECDLVISSYTFTELRRSLQKKYIPHLLSKAKRGYLLCTLYPQHYLEKPFKKTELLRQLKASLPALTEREEIPLTGKDNYIVTWSKNHD